MCNFKFPPGITVSHYALINTIIINFSLDTGCSGTGCSGIDDSSQMLDHQIFDRITGSRSLEKERYIIHIPLTRELKLNRFPSKKNSPSSRHVRP